MYRVLGKWYGRLLELPPNVPQEHYQWIVFANHVDLFAVANNAVFIIIFIHLRMYLAALCCVVIAASFACSLFSKLRGGQTYKRFVAFLFFILASGSAGCALMAGWDCGFQYYILALILAAFYIPFSGKIRLFITSVLLFGLFITVFFLSLSLNPMYKVPVHWQQAFFLISITGFTFSLLYFPLSNKRANRIAMQTLSTTLEKNAELERLSRLKDDFLANTSHELRTPLHGISGIAESLRTDSAVQSSPFIRSNLEHIITSARRLTNLVDDILDFSKMRHNDLHINLQPLHIVPVIESILPNFRSSAKQKGIDIITDLPDNLPCVQADVDRFIQIMFNLIGNAVKFTDRGNVTIKGRLDSDRVTISVVDTGIGMTTQDTSSIFDAFEQAPSSKTNWRGGTGLGLSITKRLIELHNGSISVTSTHGKGSCFTFSLPVAYRDDNQRESHELPEPQYLNRALLKESECGHAEFVEPEPLSIESAPSSAKGRLVLAVDDEPINLQIVKNYLQPLGMKVITAGDGMSVEQLIGEYRPELILLDIMMPKLNGYEVCRNIRLNYSSVEMPVIFISAKNRISDLVHGFEAGANDYVLKPFLREELIARVQGQLRQREAVEAIKQVAALKEKLADHLIEEANLKQTQERLTRLLHSVDDALVVVDENETIIFANKCFKEMLGFNPAFEIENKRISSLRKKHAGLVDLMTAKLSRKNFTPVLFYRSNGEALDLSVKRIPVEIGDDSLSVFLIRHRVNVENAERMAELICSELEKNQSRIAELEKLNAEFIEANKRIAEHLRLGEKETEDPFTLSNLIMNEVIVIWKIMTGGEKWDFAKKSGLWKVHPDADGWQRTVTLDKYLDFRKMPRFPRWNNIIASARFVIAEAQKRNYKSDSVVKLVADTECLKSLLTGNSTITRFDEI